MKIKFITFGKKYHHSEELDLQIDVRFLPNPHYVPSLKDKSGLDDDIYNYVLNSPEGNIFKQKIVDYLDYYFENISFHDELCVGICCTGGKHRSVAVSRFLVENYRDRYECVSIHLEEQNWGE